jgi:NAD(P)-dependent dehydrogenase (short-subunit alcohol dehydrogenase family)
MINLSGKIAVVTGASRGIGQAIAIALATAGADVCSFHLPDPTYAPQTEDGIRKAGRRAMMIEGDVAKADQVQACADRVVEEWGGIDIWVNNASRIFVRPFLETSETDWRDLMGSNLFGYCNGCGAAIRAMLPNKRGHIINISSVTDLQPIANMTAYVTAKSGVVGLTKSLALEFAPHGLVINAVAPGAIETPLTTGLYTPKVRKAYQERIAVGRVGKPDDIAGIVVFLASDSARYVCGHELVVDGGLHINGNVGFDPIWDGRERGHPVIKI